MTSEEEEMFQEEKKRFHCPDCMQVGGRGRGRRRRGRGRGREA
jgi:hypothetical protein